MPLTLVLDTAPTGGGPPDGEPVTRDEARDYARITDTRGDSVVDGLITAARTYVERVYRIQLLTATWKLYLDGFPPRRSIIIPRPPLISVASVTYTDETGTGQTWPSSDYQTDLNSKPGRIRPIGGGTYPSTQADTFGTVIVTYDAGFGVAAAVPDEIKTAINLRVQYFYDRPEKTTLLERADALLASYRDWSVIGRPVVTGV
jgi:uncharacterized phiE125 gp8 family phage protein